MEEHVEKIECSMAKDPIQMVVEGVAYDFRNLLESIRSRACMALHQTALPDMAQNMTTQIIQLIDQNTILADFLEQFADTRKCNKQVVDLNRVTETIFKHAAHRMKGCYPERKGLGLTLARNIVDSHGGTIDIWSTPGRGSAFSINLPLGYFEKTLSEAVSE
ncbi:ATP-binding protein [uncultured Desulfobacter sp.]|uniref:ATP-binding protein n=1 Tax=uncultured Desulfobacter sp. TaxID=240139 RepID=UPI0029F5674D|nr:ATP-binding protein [uncultured Desulfobacter sp.]